MCGIVGGIAQREISPILLEGLKRLEYRGYDSAGLAVINEAFTLSRVRAVGKVSALEQMLEEHPVEGQVGIAHTRWATHGKPTENNAHPQLSKDAVAVVHNGIIENHHQLREKLTGLGFEFHSETDTEVIVHCISHYLEKGQDLLEATRSASDDLQGAFAIAVISVKEPERIVATRRGSPLVLGIGIGEHFVASDYLALLPVTQKFIYLDEGDTVDVTRAGYAIIDCEGSRADRPVKELTMPSDTVDRGQYRHFMQKEIFEQPTALKETLEGRISQSRVLDNCFGTGADEVFDQVKQVHIVACGTSFHAGLVARYWFESIAGLACSVEVASEYRYRKKIVPEGTLFVTLSQSGETADTLAALREAKTCGQYLSTLAICNVPESSLVRASDLMLMTHAGPEIGVASTKAFTSQLASLLLLVVCLGRRHGLTQEVESTIIKSLRSLPEQARAVLALDEDIKVCAERFVERQHTLFLGRGAQYPVAMEGALKLKEISYIHAEAYPAGELKHGPLALVDREMPVVVVAPKNDLLEKLKSNLEEVRARGGEIFVFAEAASGVHEDENIHVMPVPPVDDITAPILYTMPLQLLAYHVAVLKGTDVDQPRNLAKSVTVE